MPHCRFFTVDVFTEHRFAGNPLAVVLDAEQLSDRDMQRVAAEFGYSETTFVLPPDDPANTARIRIFTPVTEVPFAGHPNVGTAYILGRLGTVFGKPVGDRASFEEKAGLVEIDLRRDTAGHVSGARIRAPGPLLVGAEIDPAVLAGCLSLPAQAIVIARHRPVFVSVGLKFIIAELDGLDALHRSTPDIAALERLRNDHADEQCDCATFLYVRVDDGHVRARMYAPFDNVAEDPATGSASAALGAYLARLDAFSGTRDLLVEQGVEMGRRSLIHVQVSSDAGDLRSVFVSGACAEVMTGRITV